MFAKYLVGINWVDFLILGLVIRMCYIGLKTGVAIELFKLLSLWLATVIAFHIYTTPVADILNERLPALPLDAADVFVFVALLTIVTIIVRIIRESFFVLIKIQARNTLDRWGGILIGLLRGLWISSLVLFIMIISTVQYLEISGKSSLTGHKLMYMAPGIYKVSFQNFVSKLIGESKSNKEVDNALER